MRTAACICDNIIDGFDGKWELLGSEAAIAGADVRLVKHDSRCPDAAQEKVRELEETLK